MQLAENACQHGGTGIVRMGSSVQDGTAVLWVHDSGPGVPPEAGDHVFERFVKTPGRRESSGLGLSIVAAIAKAHGGRAHIDRKAGPGARFEIVLPVSSRVPVTSS
jgi:signal transduction histidine kinase